jgi:hypothetical protein
MAVNLLALANKLGSGLGSGSSGSRTRNSYQNQPGNLRRGTYIPGTNLKEDQGIRKTARKGRKGDTKLRKVGGRVAHVNTTEANAIDKLGPLGEAWVESIGSGTTNPSTGLKEYHAFIHKHGAHTKVGKFIEKGADIVSGGSGQDVSTKLEEKENRKLYGPKYGESGGKQYYTDQLNSLLNKNIAGIQSTALEEGRENGFGDLAPGEGNLPGPPYGNFGEMMKKQFKIKPSSSDFSTFAPQYKKAEEDKLVGDYKRMDEEYDIEFGGGGESGMSTSDVKKEGIAQTLKDAMSSVGSAVKSTASSLSSGLFGMLTQSSQKAGSQGFAGAGDFQSEFEQNQALEEANTSFQDADDQRESAQSAADLDTDELANLKGTADITLESGKAGIIGQIQALHDEYNQAFHTGANNWIKEKYS